MFLACMILIHLLMHFLKAFKVSGAPLHSLIKRKPVVDSVKNVSQQYAMQLR